MVYKGDYEPSELLCPETYTWVTLDENLRKKIDDITEKKIKSSRLSNEQEKKINEMQKETDPKKI